MRVVGGFSRLMEGRKKMATRVATMVLAMYVVIIDTSNGVYYVIAKILCTEIA